MECTYLVKFGLFRKDLEKEVYPFENKQTVIVGLSSLQRFVLELPGQSEIFEIVNIGQVDDIVDILEEFKKVNKPESLETGNNQNKEE